MIERNRDLFDKSLSYDDLIRKMGVAIPNRLSVKLRESIRDGGAAGAGNNETGEELMQLLSTSCVANREAEEAKEEESKVDNDDAKVPL